MHEEIRNDLEGYLSGEPVSRSFTRHLADCEGCEREVRDIREVSTAFQTFREPGGAEIEVPAGFYARVANRIQTEQSTPVWGLFFPDLQFYRRVAFASLMFLAVLGSYLVSREADYVAASGPSYAALTEHNSLPAHDASEDRQHILFTLAAYEH